MDALYEAALANTMREFPWKLDSLAHVIFKQIQEKYPGMAEEEMEEGFLLSEELAEKTGMYVLTNDAGVNGASCLLYDGVIRDFAKVQGRNVFILPSSIHELMLVPEQEDTEPAFLKELVVEANQSAVGLVDLLSDSLYYYDRERDTVSIYEAGETA